MKFNVAYHPVWEQTLTELEKETYEKFLHQHKSQTSMISTCPVVVKQKKNGGIVATVFICNGLEQVLTLQETVVEVLQSDNETIAREHFTLNFSIPPKSAMLWSFVFQEALVNGVVKMNHTYTIELGQVE